jgi:CheY-like chemotaxis protein
VSSSLTILVVEDDLELRQIVCDVLDGAGYGTVTASNGRDALDLLITGGLTPALILLDLRMPIMDGWEFARVARCYTRLARVPIVVVSTPSPGMRWHPDVSGVLPKPFTSESLLAEVSRHAPRQATG